jgi:hypothetical protein
VSPHPVLTADFLKAWAVKQQKPNQTKTKKQKSNVEIEGGWNGRQARREENTLKLNIIVVIIQRQWKEAGRKGQFPFQHEIYSKCNMMLLTLEKSWFMFPKKKTYFPYNKGNQNATEEQCLCHSQLN